MTTQLHPWHDRAAKPSEEDLVIDDLDPRYRPFAFEMLNWLRGRDHNPFIIWGRRSFARQQNLVRGGTSQRLDSPHLEGLATDIVDRHLWWGADPPPPKPPRTAAEKAKVDALWTDIGIYCEKTGLEWGGLWKSIHDPAHVQWAEGAKTLADQAIEAAAMAPNDFDDDPDTETTLDEVVDLTPTVPAPAPRVEVEVSPLEALLGRLALCLGAWLGGRHG